MKIPPQLKPQTSTLSWETTTNGQLKVHLSKKGRHIWHHSENSLCKPSSHKKVTKQQHEVNQYLLTSIMNDIVFTLVSKTTYLKRLKLCLEAPTFTVMLPLSFLSFIFSISSDGRSLNSASFGVSASRSIKGSFTIPNLLSCPMSLSKTYLRSKQTSFAVRETNFIALLLCKS